MPPTRLLAVAAALGGIASLAVALGRGEANAGVFVVFPFVSGSGPFSALGVLLLMAAAGLWFVVLPHGPGGAPWRGSRSWSGSGGVAMLGPFPIAWGSSPRALLLAMLLALALVVGLLALALLTR